MTPYAGGLLLAVLVVSFVIVVALLLTEPGAWWRKPTALAVLAGTAVALVAIIAPVR